MQKLRDFLGSTSVEGNGKSPRLAGLLLILGITFSGLATASAETARPSQKKTAASQPAAQKMSPRAFAAKTLGVPETAIAKNLGITASELADWQAALPPAKLPPEAAASLRDQETIERNILAFHTTVRKHGHVKVARFIGRLNTLAALRSAQASLVENQKLPEDINEFGTRLCGLADAVNSEILSDPAEKTRYLALSGDDLEKAIKGDLQDMVPDFNLWQMERRCFQMAAALTVSDKLPPQVRAGIEAIMGRDPHMGEVIGFYLDTFDSLEGGILVKNAPAPKNGMTVPFYNEQLLLRKP